MTTSQSASEQLRFDDRVAVVTGAGGGLGRQHALLLASRGAAVIVNDLGGALDGTGGSPGPAAAVAEEIRSLGGIAVADSNTVATAEGGAAIVQRAIDEFGRIDIVVNNAGILRDKTFHNMTPEMWDAVLAVHLTGAFNVTHPAYLRMREQGYGRIITTSSGAGLYGNFGQANYSSAKMGLVGLAKTIATEGARKNVKANAIAPIALTRMTQGLMGDGAERFDPAFVAPMVTWLCHESCSVSGEVFAIGGGRVARVVVAENPGYTSRTLTPEDIAANIDTIMDTSRLDVPTDVNSATKLVNDALKALA